jgi:phosphomannomutase
VKYVLGKRQGKVAINLSTSRMVEDVAAAADSEGKMPSARCEVIRTPVGEAHVANAMVANGCVIGGEGNGGVIDLRVAPVRDSFVGMALVLALLAETGKTVSELVGEIPRYEMAKTKYACPQGEAGAVLARVREYYERAGGAAKVDVRDGVRVDLPEGWVQLRASNTEPIVRLMAESREAAVTERLIAEARQVAGL